MKNKFFVVMCALWNTIIHPFKGSWSFFTDQDSVEILKALAFALIGGAFIFCVPVLPEIVMYGFFIHIRKKDYYDKYVGNMFLAGLCLYILFAYPVITSAISAGAAQGDPMILDFFLGNTVIVLISVVVPHVAYYLFMFFVTAFKYIWNAAKSKFEENMEICAKK